MKIWRNTLIGTSFVVSCGLVLAAPLQAEILKGQAPIILTLMTHTDGRYPPTSTVEFTRDKGLIVWGMNLYEGFGVKMNLEASKAFAEHDTVNGFLEGVRLRGHGVGTHCNTTRGITSQVVLEDEIMANKKAVDDKVAAGTNVSISGICSALDWVIAAGGAGFKITDGGVGYCYLSMASSARPVWLTDALIESKYFHDSAPFGFQKRISPIRLENADDFEADSPGTLTLSNGEIGELASLSEGRYFCAPVCTLDKDDFEVVYLAIETVKALKRPHEVGRINIHVPTKLMIESNRALLEEFLDRLRAYAAARTIVFGTEKDVSDTYDDWRL